MKKNKKGKGKDDKDTIKKVAKFAIGATLYVGVGVMTGTIPNPMDFFSPTDTL